MKTAQQYTALWIDPKLRAKLKVYASYKGKSMKDVVEDFIKSLRLPRS